VQQSEEYP